MFLLILPNANSFGMNILSWLYLAHVSNRLCCEAYRRTIINVVFDGFK